MILLGKNRKSTTTPKPKTKKRLLRKSRKSRTIGRHKLTKTLATTGVSTATTKVTTMTWQNVCSKSKPTTN